jgi:type I restriction-modification system DNA methylase subunit
MSLFQQSVLTKHLKNQDKQKISESYIKFKSHFHNPAIQENIRNAKEEQYQGEFLIDLFVNVLGYTKYPTPNFNLTTEYKNVKDSKKADGAIIIHDVVKAVIELKGTNTTDLSKIETQAFGYKNNQPECVYVITSNFEKLRFYIDNAIDYYEFNLFTLTEKEFELLYLCLAFENIEKGLPKKLKDESLSQEDVITKKLYNDYSLFKRKLHQNLVELNPEFEPLELFKKSQKLLDRFLFLFFAEDRQLLPPNSVKLILTDWRDLQERDVEIPLYNRFKKYFEYLNTGFKGKRYNVFAYNGGLFKPDEILDSVKIDDELLYQHTLKLSEYDFDSEVDVNILGHIFENSLNELDEIKAQLEGTEIDKTKTKRKKDGVFYTPKYITKYIVDNTVGKLCFEKKEELQINEDDYITDRKRAKKTVQSLVERLANYRKWLLQLKICDPACGSGAFLNQALDFLIHEHRYIDELQAKLFGDAMVLTDMENSILENNLFGVDINEESVEIAKLSLWLRTAQPNRKLNDLSNNIKCGNSLIDDLEIAGEKAFNWFEEFPSVFPSYRKPKEKIVIEPEPGDRDYLDEVFEPAYSYKVKSKGFEKHGFDCIIGNPPYVQLQSLGEMSDKLKNCGYQTYDKGADLYCIFTERGYQLLKNGGIQSFIMPNKWMLVAYGKPLRKFLSNTGLLQVLNFGDIQFFQEAATIVCIFVTQKGEPKKNIQVLSLNQKTYNGDFMTEVKANLYDYESSRFGENEWSIQPLNDSIKLEKMKLKGIELKNLPISINYGIKTGFNEAFLINEKTRKILIEADSKSAELIKPMVRGRDILPYGITGFEYLINVHNGIKEKNPEILPIIIDDYPALKKHLDAFLPFLEKRGDKGNTTYNLRNCAYLEDFAKPKILYPNMTSVFPFTYDESGMMGNDKTFILTSNDESVSLLFLTALFNSSLAKLWIWYNCPELLGGTREIRKVYFEHFPVPMASQEQKEILEQYARERTNFTSNIQALISKFTRNIQREFNLEKLSTKLENWYHLTYNEFLKEIEKNKVKLSLSQKAEWEDYFIQESKKALEIKHQIETTDNEIDRMVYELYELTEEEIGVVEGI